MELSSAVFVTEILEVIMLALISGVLMWFMISYFQKKPGDGNKGNKSDVIEKNKEENPKEGE